MTRRRPTPPVLVSEREMAATDGYPLAATIYKTSPQREGKAAIIAGAVGVRRSRYRDFATYLAGRGWAVVTFDYRGIGGSRRGCLSKSPARLRDWGERDAAGVIEWVHHQFGPRRCVAVGHSVGGQIIGFAPNHGRLDALLTIASQKGYWKYWRGLWRYLVGGFWRVVPALVGILGYLPLWPAGCEDLPPQVALEWQRWGMRPEFVDEERRSMNHRFHTFTAPILAMSFADDPLYAPPRAVEALLKVYANAPSVHRHFHPRDLGVRRIGHSGFFDPGVCPALWEVAVEWLDRADGSGPQIISALAEEGAPGARLLGAINSSYEPAVSGE